MLQSYHRPFGHRPLLGRLLLSNLFVDALTFLSSGFSPVIFYIWVANTCMLSQVSILDVASYCVLLLHLLMISNGLSYSLVVKRCTASLFSKSLLSTFLLVHLCGTSYALRRGPWYIVFL